MAAVPLHLFSLLGLNIKMAAPKETEDEADAESKGWVRLTFHISARAVDERETVYAADFEKEGIPVTYGLNSIKDRLRHWIISIK